MKYVHQVGSLYVCHRAGVFGQEIFPNHGSSKVIGWVYGSAPGDVGMLCSFDNDARVHSLIPFNPMDICCMARTESGLMHEE